MMIVRNLTKTFPPNDTVLSSISFQADAGEFVAIMGGSGSGKSVLLKCLSFREKWTSGQYVIDGAEMTNPGLLERWRLGKQWAVLEEKPSLNGGQSAVKNVRGGRFYHTPLWRLLTRTASRDEHMLAMDALEKVGLLDKAHEKASALSGGEQQRVAIARALVRGAKVIVADEPVSGLDPKSGHAVLADLKALCVKEGITVICTLHQVELAEKYASRIWGLSGGRIVLDIPGRSLTQREKQLVL